VKIRSLVKNNTAAAICIMCHAASATHTNSAALASGDTIKIPVCDGCAASIESKATRAALMKKLEPYRLARPRTVYVQEHYRRRPQRLQDVFAEIGDKAVAMGVRIGGERFVNTYIEARGKGAQGTADDE